jgi:hypothetical protein
MLNAIINLNKVMQRFFTRTLIGIKRGLLTPNLPPEILEFQRKPLIRIFRVIGGLSFLTILGRGYISFKLSPFLFGLFILFYFFSVLFFIYHLYISYHRFKHIKFLFKSGALDVRNSPLDKYAGMLIRVLTCAKGVCDSATPIGLGLGLMLGADQTLKEVGREAFFGPILGKGLIKILPKSDLDHWKDTYLEATNRLNNTAKGGIILTELLDNVTDLTDVSSDDKKDLLQLLLEMKESNDLDLESAKEHAIKALENKPE